MSGMLRVKLGRDLRASWSRLALMVVAVAVSLTAFGGVFFAWATIGRESSRAYVSTEPASATILLDRPIATGQMAAIAARARQRPGVIQATGRTQFTSESVRVNGQARALPLQLFVATPDDPMRMAKFFPRQRGWPPAPGEVFIGEDSLSLLGVAVGDVVTVQAPSGDPVRLQVAGTVYDPSLSPASQEQTARGYLSTASLPTGQAGLDQLKLQVADPGQATPSRDRDRIVTVAGQAGQWLQRDWGLAIREVQVPKPYAHPHQWQADALLQSLLAGGAAALLLATLLVANMLNNLFTQQIPQIGILKAVGARSGRIGRLYLAMTLLVAAAATLLALGPAILIGRALVGRFLVGQLGIQPTSLGASWWAYPVVLAAGLGLAPLLALVPLVKASRTTVRAAIDQRGGGGSKPSAATGVLARLGRLRRLDRGLLMALRNTVRRPARFWLSVGLLASAGTVFVAGMSLSSSVAAVTEEANDARRWDVDAQLASPAALSKIATLVGRLPDVSRVEGLNVTPTGVAGPGQIPITRTYPDQGHARVQVTAIPPGTSLLTPPKLLEGRWLTPGETGAVVLNQVARNNTVPGIGAGDTVQLLVGGRPTSWRVVGLVEEKGGGSSVYATAAGLAAATGQPQRVNQLRIATTSHDEPTRTAVADAVTATLTGAGLKVASAASVGRGEAISEGHLGPEVTIILAIAVAMGIVGGIGLASTMSANVLDRTREFGVMHAIGARPKAVRRIVTAEGIFLALTSLLVAALPALGLTAVLGAGLGNLFFSAPLPYRVSLLAVGSWVVLVVLGATLSTEAAATRAARLTVREALTYL
jgi:putative ABC transport system permease protein